MNILIRYNVFQGWEKKTSLFCPRPNGSAVYYEEWCPNWHKNYIILQFIHSVDAYVGYTRICDYASDEPRTFGSFARVRHWTVERKKCITTTTGDVLRYALWRVRRLAGCCRLPRAATAVVCWPTGNGYARRRSKCMHTCAIIFKIIIIVIYVHVMFCTAARFGRLIS